MLKFLVDESSGKKLASLLKSSYDTVFVGEVMPSSPDSEVLEFAEKESRVLITDDKDFGELVFRLRKAARGVILLRMQTTDPERRYKVIRSLINSLDSLDDKFIVLGEKTARIRTIKPDR